METKQDNTQKPTINMNDHVSVILTEHGAKFLNEDNASLNKRTDRQSFKTDYKKGDVFKCQLFQLFVTFSGANIHSGSYILFENLTKEADF